MGIVLDEDEKKCTNKMSFLTLQTNLLINSKALKINEERNALATFSYPSIIDAEYL